MTHAVANPGSTDSDEIIRTAPETLPDLTVDAPPPADAVKADTAAVQTPVAPLPIEAAETSERVLREWARPQLAAVQEAAQHYSSNLEVRTARTPSGQTQTKVAVALGETPQSRIADRMAKKVGFHNDARSTFGKRGRWYLFAATDNDAVGYNMLGGMHGALRRAGFTAERIAAIGDRQVGLAWRKGQVQASLAYVERELSTFGASVEQRFVALTISFKGWGRTMDASPKRISRYAPYEPDWPPQERDRRLRR